MLFETVCHNCGKLCRDLVPALSKQKALDLICPNCDFQLLSFYEDSHPITKYVKEGLS